MPSKNKENKPRKRFLGKYTLPDGGTEVAELHLAGGATRLLLHSHNNLENVTCVTAYAGLTSVLTERLTSNFGEKPNCVGAFCMSVLITGA
jgi:hypothetical protein